MDSSPKVPQDDQAFLDWIFDQAVDLLEDGGEIQLESLIQERDHLRDEVQRLVTLAEQMTVERRRTLPQLREYVILEELGHGGMGTVYLARQERLGGRLLALKVLPQVAALSKSARDRFRNEAKVIAGLRHPNILTVHDVIDDDGVHAYTMEWVEGKSLSGIIKHIQVLEREALIGDAAEILAAPDEALRASTYPIFICQLGIAVARALGEVHRAGLLHRDVKPSNILQPPTIDDQARFESISDSAKAKRNWQRRLERRNPASSQLLHFEFRLPVFLRSGSRRVTCTGSQ